MDNQEKSMLENLQKYLLILINIQRAINIMKNAICCMIFNKR